MEAGHNTLVENYPESVNAELNIRLIKFQELELIEWNIVLVRFRESAEIEFKGVLEKSPISDLSESNKIIHIIFVLR